MKELFKKVGSNSIEILKTTKNSKFCFKIILVILFSYLNFKLINNILCNELNSITNQDINISISNKYICKCIIFFIIFIIVFFFNFIKK